MMFMCNKTYTMGSGVRLVPPPSEFLTKKLFVVFFLFFLFPSLFLPFLFPSLSLSSEDWRLDNVALYLSPPEMLPWCSAEDALLSFPRLAVTSACCGGGRGFKAGLAGSFSSPGVSQEMDPPPPFIQHQGTPGGIPPRSGYSFPPWNPCSVRNAGKESHQLMVILSGKQLDILKSIVLVGQSMNSYPSIRLWIDNSFPQGGAL